MPFKVNILQEKVQQAEPGAEAWEDSQGSPTQALLIVIVVTLLSSPVSVFLNILRLLMTGTASTVILVVFEIYMVFLHVSFQSDRALEWFLAKSASEPVVIARRDDREEDANYKPVTEVNDNEAKDDITGKEEVSDSD